MAKKNRQQIQQAVILQPIKTPWYKKVWVVISIVVTSAFAFAINSSTIFNNLEKLPSDFQRVSNQFFTWYYDDDAWNGLWSANVEGYVDIEDMNLSQTDIQLHLMAQQGHIGGEISLRSICRSTPFNYFLLDGTVKGDTAYITAFDIFGGKKLELFKFSALREGVVLTVSPETNNSKWIKNNARIALHPKTVEDDPYKILGNYCAEERNSNTKSKNESNERLPISKLKFSN
jgi:hypothetical protein